MKSLTIRQPWAFAIAHAGKTVENRTWNTRQRGLIAIHAGVTIGYRDAVNYALEQVTKLSGLPPKAVRDGAQVRGAIVAVADLTHVCSKSRDTTQSCLRCGCGPWAMSGQHHFRLADVRPLPKPVPVAGGQRFWNLPDEVEAAVRAQLEAADA